jgi:hypothetical protein
MISQEDAIMMVIMMVMMTTRQFSILPSSLWRRDG